MRNSNLVLPARFMSQISYEFCNKDDLHRATNPQDMLPLEGFKNVISSRENISAIQLIIKEAFEMWKEDLNV